MNAIECIKQSLEASRDWAMMLIEDMKDSPMAQPSPQGGNHPVWVMGHVTFGESHLLDSYILGKENRFPELKEMFDMGTKPTADASLYPPMSELLVKFDEIRTATLAHLDTLSEAELDQRSHAPEEMKGFFETVGHCFNAMSNHHCFHAGQVAASRTALGKEPMFG